MEHVLSLVGSFVLGAVVTYLYAVYRLSKNKPLGQTLGKVVIQGGGGPNDVTK